MGGAEAGQCVEIKPEIVTYGIPVGYRHDLSPRSCNITDVGLTPRLSRGPRGATLAPFRKRRDARIRRLQPVVGQRSETTIRFPSLLCTNLAPFFGFQLRLNVGHARHQ